MAKAKNPTKVVEGTTPSTPPPPAPPEDMTDLLDLLGGDDEEEDNKGDGKGEDEGKDNAPPAPTKTDEAPKVASSVVVVAKGRAITTRSRGILSGDSVPAPVVRAEDFFLGEKRIEQLITAGYLSRK